MPPHAASATSPPATTPLSNRPIARWGLWFAVLAVLIATAGSIGGPHGPGVAMIVILESLVRTAWPAGLVLISAWGVGELIGSLIGQAADRPPPPVRFALGLAVFLSVSHVLGTLGLLNTWTAALLPAIGAVGAMRSMTRSSLNTTRPRHRGPSGWMWVSLPGLALLLTAAASPPGALWASEYGGYDVLSYHLQLPAEWLALGHTRPIEHNAYSFLPGSLEIAYTHLAWLTGAGTDGLLEGGGWRLISTQYLHAGLAIASAWIVARLARRLSAAAGLDAKAGRVASTVAGGLVLCTPWTIVVGSMAYNEMGVVALGAAAMLAACRRSSRPAVQAAIVGFLVGVACCVKPTALFFVGLPAGVLLLRFAAWRDWGEVIAVGALAGLLALSPWLVRNAAMTGNPVFPFATDSFGTGHWTAEQADRWATAHAFDGSLLDRLGLLARPDPAAEPDANPVARWRGVTNPQWMIAFPAGLLGALPLLRGKRPRLIAVGLLLGLTGQLAAWGLFTHLQSRFLIPCLLTLAPLAGLGAARVRRPRGAGAGLGVTVCIVQAIGAWVIFAGQRGGSPNALLLAGPPLYLGEPYSPEVGAVSPVAFINHEVPQDATVLLVGQATPLYIDRRVVYATVWDRPPVLDWMQSADTNDVPEADYILIDHAELARQRHSGYLDPALTPGFLRTLIEGLAPIRSWSEAGQSLYRVPRGNRP